MPTVTLLDFTGKGRPDECWHAAHLLIFTKATRLSMTPDLLAAVQAMPEEDKLKELAYMATTIPSSWEFVDLTFLLSGVTRACAQQITRTRQASYAMQSQRVVDMSSGSVTNPFATLDPKCKFCHGTGTFYESHGGGMSEALSCDCFISELTDTFEAASERAVTAYGALIAAGAKKEDARGVLPMNTQCNLVAKYHLRALVDLVLARKSLRVQGEYNEIVHQMEAAVLAVWPWAASFFVPKHEKAIAILERVAKELGITTGSGPGWDIAKAIDLIRKG